MDPPRRSVELSVNEQRLVVLGDPHGDVPGLEHVLAREDGPAVRFVSVGDNVGYADGQSSSRLCSMLAARRIASVYGNHEEWLGDDGTLAIVRPSEADIRLTEQAFEWCRALPQRLDLGLSAARDWSLAVVHHLEASYFDFVSNDVRRPIRLHGVDLLFVGHTHGPKVFEWTSDDEVRLHLLDPAATEPLLLELRTGHRYVVDAGSLAKPAHHPQLGNPRRGSYATLDVRERMLALHAFLKPSS